MHYQPVSQNLVQGLHTANTVKKATLKAMQKCDNRLWFIWEKGSFLLACLWGSQWTLMCYHSASIIADNSKTPAKGKTCFFWLDLIPRRSCPLCNRLRPFSSPSEQSGCKESHHPCTPCKDCHKPLCLTAPWGTHFWSQNIPCDRIKHDLHVSRKSTAFQALLARFLLFKQKVFPKSCMEKGAL